MENKFKLKKPLPKSWGVQNDGSQEFKEWVIGYMNQEKNAKLIGETQNVYYGININAAMGWSRQQLFSTILTLEEFKSHFEVENEWREASTEYVGYVTPKMMEVSDDKESWGKRLVFFEYGGCFLCTNSITEAIREGFCGWLFAREVQEPTTVTITMDEVRKLLNLPSDAVVVIEGEGGGE